MTLNRLLLTVATPVMLWSMPSLAFAQTTIETDTTGPVETDTAGDVTINSGVTVTVPTDSTGVRVNSDDDVVNNGGITSEDVNNVVGVELQGGNTGNFTNGGTIALTESFQAEDTDNDNVLDGPFAQGTGRTGILISGASPFTGNVTQSTGASINVEGNDSFGIRLADGASLVGDMLTDGIINILGANVVGVGIEGQIIGNLATFGRISTQGENSTAINIQDDIDGQFTNSANIVNTGYRFSQRLGINNRDLLGDEDTLQAGAAIAISSNISGGVLFDEVETTTTNDDGAETTTVTARSVINQFGEAPAILIDGQGTPIAIGVVGAVLDPTADDYDAELVYAFVNQGDITAQGVNNDINATTFVVRDATLTGGINNSGTLNATAFRGGNNGLADAEGRTGAARVIVIGDNVIAERINNTGVILARVTEAADEIYADVDSIIPPRLVSAMAIDIAASSQLSTLNNIGSISAIITARSGEAVAIRDSSGTLIEINNSGQIVALGENSDALGVEPTDFNLIALDLAANTSGITLRQTAPIDSNPDDNLDPIPSQIRGDIFLGSGDDVVDIQSGFVIGDVNLGAGNDTLTLNNNASLTGNIIDPNSTLVLTLANGSTLTQTSTSDINVTSATIDGTSTFRPTIDGVADEVSTLTASDTIVLADGAAVAPIISNVVGVENSSFPVLTAAQGLTIEGDIAGLASDARPFLYDTAFAIDPNDPNTLLVTLDLRSTDELGLDVAQTATFASAFEALENNSGLANAIVNISDGTEFNQAYNQLLPEFAAAGRQFVLANVDGATGAVGTHLDSVRRSPDRPGGAWIQEFAYFADRELAGLSEQYRGYGFGFTGGLDTALGPFHAVGVNFGFASTEIEDVVGVDEPLDIVTLQAGVYAGWQAGNLGVEGYAGGGYNDFESRRIVDINNFRSVADGDWSGTHINGSLRGGYDLVVSDRFWVRPTVSLDYLSLTEKAYTESGDVGVALDIDKRKVEVGSASAMINLGAKFMGKRTWIRPALRAGYRTEFISDNVITTGRFAGLSTPFIIEGEDFPDSGFLLGFTLAAGSEYSSFALDFDSDIRDGFIRHTGRIVFRLLF